MLLNYLKKTSLSFINYVNNLKKLQIETLSKHLKGVI